MKANVSTAMRTYLSTRITKNFARCWLIRTTDGQTFGYTSHTRDLIFEGLTYQSILGFTASALKSEEGLNPDSITITAFLSTQDEQNITAGIYDNARVEVFIVDYFDLTLGAVVEKVGFVGAITRSDGVFSAEIVGLVQLLATKIGEVYSLSCRARLGDDRCRVLLTPLEILVVGSTSGTVLTRTDGGSFIADGFVEDTSRILTILLEDVPFAVTSVVTVATSTLTLGDSVGTDSGSFGLTQNNPFHATGQIASVTSNKQFTITFTTGIQTNSWYGEGNITFLTGSNTGLKRDIRGQIGGDIRLFLPFPFTIAVGDAFEMEAGCFKTKDVCLQKFDNIINFRGEPFLPTPEQVWNSPVSSGQTVVSAT